MTYPKVSIIILNWNGWKDTIECLESLYRITYPNYDVIVVDNGSEDESIEEIKDYAGGKIKVESKFFEHETKNKPITVFENPKNKINDKGKNLPSNRKLILIENDENYGFAKGNNIGIKYALKYLESDYILILNNDIVVDKDFLQILVNTMKNDAGIGIVGPMIKLYDKNEEIFSVGGIINWWTGRNKAILHLKSNQIKEVDYVSGCALTIRKEIFNRVGLLSEEYFLYVEEIDYCVRVNRQNYKIVNEPNAVIWHKVSSTAQNKIKIYYTTRNWFIFMKKFANLPNYVFFIFWNLTFNFLFETVKIIYMYNLKLYKYYLKGLFDGLFKKRDNN